MYKYTYIYKIKYIHDKGYNPNFSLFKEEVIDKQVTIARMRHVKLCKIWKPQRELILGPI